MPMCGAVLNNNTPETSWKYCKMIKLNENHQSPSTRIIHAAAEHSHCISKLDFSESRRPHLKKPEECFDKSLRV